MKTNLNDDFNNTENT